MLAHTTDELLRQFHDNQSNWITRLATGEMQGSASPRLFQIGDVVAMRPGRSGVIMLPMRGDFAEVIPQHDQALGWLRQQRVGDILVWGMVQDTTIDLAMLAQGYRIGFEPWWMTRDLTSPIAAPAHDVARAGDSDIDELLQSDVPYIVRDQLESTRHLIRSGNREVELLIARVEGRLAGQAIVNITGDHAGLFNVGVSGRYRHRGIGTSLSLAAMLIARDRGATTMNLNSTPMGRSIYERCGFRQIGIGQTWLRSGPGIYLNPDQPMQALTHALGTGDVTYLSGQNIPDRLPNGMTPQGLAARFGRQDSIYQLIEMGHVPEIISLWDVGLKNESMVAASNPLARESVSGDRGARPIHLAVERGAGSLVIALIEAGADLSARDHEYRATPLDWAHATNKPTIARIIRQAGGR